MFKTKGYTNLVHHSDKHAQLMLLKHPDHEASWKTPGKWQWQKRRSKHLSGRHRWLSPVGCAIGLMMARVEGVGAGA